MRKQRNRIFLDALKRLNQELVAELQLTGGLRQPSEVGLNREGKLREFLARYLPKRYSVGTGLVEDARGERSRQIDIVIYDDFYFSPLYVGEHSQVFPYASVFGAISVKSSLSKPELLDALENIASVKRLQRLAPSVGTLTPIMTLDVGPDIEISGAVHSEPACGIFSFAAEPSLGTLVGHIDEFNSGVPREQRLDILCALGSGIITYGDLHLNSARVAIPKTENSRLTAISIPDRAFELFFVLLLRLLHEVRLRFDKSEVSGYLAEFAPGGSVTYYPNAE